MLARSTIGLCVTNHLAAITVLLVEEDQEALAAMLQWLTNAGFHASAVASFEAAKAFLTASPPAVLITVIRLGAFNGLQLALRQRFGNADSVVIVIDREYDRVTEAEAKRLAADYLVKPLSEEQLVGAVRTGLVRGQVKPGFDNQRRWRRTRLDTGVPAAVDGIRATLVDVAYGGFQIEVRERVAQLPPLFVLRAHGLTRQVKAHRVWERRNEAASLVCGASLDESDPDAVATWRRSVDNWQSPPS